MSSSTYQNQNDTPAKPLLVLTVVISCLLSLLILSLPATVNAQAESSPTESNAPQTNATEILSFENDKQKNIYDDLILELRCPKCQNQNIADSNADIAQDLRKKTYELVLKNKSKNDIKQFMLARYGEFVLYKPQFSGKTLLLWIAPLILLLCVIFFVVRIIIRNAAHLNNEETTD